MATETTLSDIVDRLRAEGQLTRNTGTNSIRSIRFELTEHTVILGEMLRLMQIQEERFKLGRASQDTGGPAKPSSDKPKADESKSPTDGGNSILDMLGALGNLGMLGRIAVIGIGTALGVVIGQFKAIQLIFPKTVGSILKKITDFSTSIKTQLVTVADSIKKTLRSAGTSIMGSITDFGKWIGGLFSGATGKINQLGKAGKLFTGTISAITDAIGNIAKSFLNVGKMITGAVTTTMDLGSKFSNILKPLKSFVGAIKSVAKLVSKLFLPLTILLTAFDTITAMIDGYAEGGILGALEGGITGFFNSLIFGPLDMLKDLVSWVAGKLGFDGFAAILDSFSFSELFSTLVSSLFGGVKGVFSVITDLFTFGEEDMTALGLLGKLTDLVYAPVNMAINFVRGLFGFEETDEPFKLQDWIVGIIDDIWSFFADIIPSIEDIEKSVLSIMPDWLRKLVGAPERTSAEIVDEKMQEQKEELDAARARVAEDSYWFESNKIADQEEIARLSATVEAQNPREATIKQELETLRAERQALITEASKPRPRGGSTGKADTSAIDAKLAALEAELQVTPSPVAAASPDQTAASSTISIGNQPFVPGVPLSSVQMSAIEMSRSMGNTYPAEVMAQYNKQKSGVTAPATVTTPATTTPATAAAPTTTAQTSTYKIADEPVIPGTPLSSKQMSVIEMSLSMGNKYPTEIMTQYNKQKSGAISNVTPASPAAAPPPVVTPPDLLQSKISTPITYSVGGEKVIPGALLSSKQMTAIELSLLMGNKPPAEIMAQYNKQKAGGVSATGTPDLLQSKIPQTSSLPAEGAAIAGVTPSSATIMRVAESTLAAQQGRMSMIEKTETERAANPTIIVSAPTVAPVNNNVTGPTNISNQRVTAIGNGSAGGSGLARFAN